MPAPILQVYPLETVVAEKLEAMVKLAGFNSRLKDYFDLWILMRYEKLDRDLLPLAVHATFERRNTALPRDLPVGLSDEFAIEKRKAWDAFLRRSSLTAPAFEEIVTTLRELCWPLFESARHSQS